MDKHAALDDAAFNVNSFFFFFSLLGEWPGPTEISRIATSSRPQIAIQERTGTYSGPTDYKNVTYCMCMYKLLVTFCVLGSEYISLIPVCV